MAWFQGPALAQAGVFNPVDVVAPWSDEGLAMIDAAMVELGDIQYVIAAVTVSIDDRVW